MPKNYTWSFLDTLLVNFHFLAIHVVLSSIRREHNSWAKSGSSDIRTTPTSSQQLIFICKSMCLITNRARNNYSLYQVRQLQV